MTPLYPEELAAAKAYMRIEGDQDDLTVTSCVLAARAYLDGAGVSLPSTDNGRRWAYDLVCHGLALSYYENRGETGQPLSDNPGLRRVLNQLKYTEPSVSTLNTEGGEEEGDHGSADDP